MLDILPLLASVAIGLIGLTRSVVIVWYLRKILSDSPSMAIEMTTAWGRHSTLTVRRLPHRGSRP